MRPRALHRLSALLSLHAVLVLLLVLGAAGCSKGAAQGAPSGPPGFPVSASPHESATFGADHGGLAEDEASVSADAPARERLGLGTAFGEHRHSQVITTPFRREASTPDVLLSLHYNDSAGVRDAMHQLGSGGVPLVSSFGTGDGRLTVSLLDEQGRALPAVDVAGTRYAVGEPGQRYMVHIDNRSGERWEVVAAVDGLDVVDGETAAFHKRGYLVDPWSSITIEGWRTSESGVAAFRFSALPESYAARKGQARDIGVVGVAFFREQGSPAMREDTARRHGADPFPGRFADPPPARGW